MTHRQRDAVGKGMGIQPHLSMLFHIALSCIHTHTHTHADQNTHSHTMFVFIDFTLLTTQVTITPTITQPCVEFMAVEDNLGLEGVDTGDTH